MSDESLMSIDPVGAEVNFSVEGLYDMRMISDDTVSITFHREVLASEASQVMENLANCASGLERFKIFTDMREVNEFNMFNLMNAFAEIKGHEIFAEGRIGCLAAILPTNMDFLKAAFDGIGKLRIWGDTFLARTFENEEEAVSFLGTVNL